MKKKHMENPQKKIKVKKKSLKLEKTTSHNLNL